MPTVYTADVQSGKITEFNDFVWVCARAFGALVMMRDKPTGAPIPQRFEPDDWNAKRLAEAQAELAQIIDQPESFWEAEARRSYEGALSQWENYRAEKRKCRARYKAMLEHVASWTPPTPDHEELKKFMTEQLAESIRFDCGRSDEAEEKFDPKPTLKSWSEYRDIRLAKVAQVIAYHTEEHRKEVERNGNRNRWLEELRASLSQEETSHD